MDTPRRPPPMHTGSDAPIPGRCGARLRNTVRYCKARPLPGRTRCRLHGGLSRFGPDHGRFSTGMTVDPKYAYLSPRVYEQFQRHLEDERLLDLKPDIALMEVLKGEAARGMTVGESEQLWGEAIARLGEALRAEATPDEVLHVVRSTLALMTGAHAKAAARDEVGRTLERRGRLVKTYRTLLVETGDLIPAARVALVLNQISGLVREFLRSDDERAEFSRRFVGLIGPKLRIPDRAERHGGGGGPEDHGGA